MGMPLISFLASLPFGSPITEPVPGVFHLDDLPTRIRPEG